MRRFRMRVIAPAFRRGRVALAGACLAVAGCNADAPGNAGSATGVPVDGGVAVASYCATFGTAYADRQRVDLVADSVRAEPRAVVWKWISNLFQPPGSRFAAAYRCRFATRSPAGERRAVSVELYLAQTRAFAEHTQWESLQIVPIERVVDRSNGTAGYGVFKYPRQE